MNGVHDMGGLTCYGPVVREENEPVFHASWERHVFSMGVLVGGHSGTFDAFRHAIERMDPVHYLSSSYYEHWLAALETFAVEQGFISPEEFASGRAETKGNATKLPLPPEAVPHVVTRGSPCDRKEGRLLPCFKAGDRVRAKNLNPSRHTRLPRYARGKVGIIDRVYGTFVYPDTSAHGGGEQPQPLYCVRFDAIELWGPDAPRKDNLRVDLWEDYLEAV
jgi:nitrile hydratase